jgi:hypothetical protein
MSDQELDAMERQCDLIAKLAMSAVVAWMLAGLFMWGYF